MSGPWKAYCRFVVLPPCRAITFVSAMAAWIVGIGVIKLILLYNYEVTSYTIDSPPSSPCSHIHHKSATCVLTKQLFLGQLHQKGNYVFIRRWSPNWDTCNFSKSRYFPISKYLGKKLQIRIFKYLRIMTFFRAEIFLYFIFFSKWGNNFLKGNFFLNFFLYFLPCTMFYCLVRLGDLWRLFSSKQYGDMGFEILACIVQDRWCFLS